MQLIFVPYSIALIITAIISAVAAAAVWPRRSAPGGWWLFLLMASLTEWTLASTFEAAAVDLSSKILFSKISYPGAHASLPFFLLFTLEYTGQVKRITWRHIVLVFAAPLITVGLAFTNELHSLIWTGFEPGPAGTNSYIYLHGLWFYIASLILYGEMFMIAWIMLRFALVHRELYRYQSAALIIALALPLLSFASYILNLNPFPGLDLAAISFAGSGAILVIMMVRMHFLETIPIARDTLIEEMSDGMLVLDEQSRIVDINPAAKKLIGIETNRWIGQPARSVLINWPDLARQLNDAGSYEHEITRPGASSAYIDLRVSALTDHQGRVSGKLIILRDITRRKQDEAALQRSNLQLKEKIGEIQSLQEELREQANRDPLTGLFNRRYLNEILEREFNRAVDEQTSLAMVMLDIDHFKSFNDRYGHKAGDDMLQSLGLLLRSHTRPGDIACRYGGEEFLVIMPGANPAAAQRRADQWRIAFEDFCLEHGDFRIFSTFSGGVAAYPENGSTANAVLRATDDALYIAKDAGRNRIIIAPR